MKCNIIMPSIFNFQSVPSAEEPSSQEVDEIFRVVEDPDIELEAPEQRARLQPQVTTIILDMLDLVGLVIIPVVGLRILKYMVNYVTFSSDSIIDLNNYISVPREQISEIHPGTLIAKFSESLLNCYPHLGNYPLVLKVVAVLLYVIFALTGSMYLMMSFAFYIMCLIPLIARKWYQVQKFAVRTYAEGNGVF